MNTVKYIKNNKLSLQDRIAILNLGRPMPELNLSTASVLQNNSSKPENSKRSSNQSIYEKCSWICGCEETNSFYCFICLLSGKEKFVDLCWIKNGADLKNITTRIKAHENTHLHISNEYDVALLRKLAKTPSSGVESDEERNKEIIAKNKYFLSRIIDCILFCGAFELDWTDDSETSTSEESNVLSDLLSFVAKMDSVFETSFETYLEGNLLFQKTLKQIEEELLDSILKVCQEEIKKELGNAKYVAIQVYEKIDSFDNMHLILILRYLNNEHLYERFWGFLNLLDHTSTGLSLAILKTLTELELDKCPEKLIAQSYDGEIFLSGLTRIIPDKIKEVYTRAQHIHCYNHDLDSMVAKSVWGYTNLRLFFACLYGFPRYFSKCKGTEVMDGIISQLLPPPEELGWDTLSSSVSLISTYHENVANCLDELAEVNFNEHYINSLLASCLNNEDDFMFWISFFNKIFPHIDILSQQIKQSHSVDIKSNVTNLTQAIQELRNDIEKSIDQELLPNSDDIFLEENEENEECLEKKRKITLIDSKVILCKEVCDVLITNLSEIFEFSDYSAITVLFDKYQFPNYEKTFPMASYKVACVVFGHINQQKLKNELSVIYARTEFREPNGLLALLRMLYKNELTSIFSETVTILTCLCTVPIVTNESERCFSTLQRINAFLENRKSQKWLNALTMLSIEKSVTEKIDDFNGEVIKHFAANCNSSANSLPPTLQYFMESNSS